jgi:hypothetical protein
MPRFAVVALLSGFLGTGALVGQQPAGLSNWAFDEITHVNGNKFQGLIRSESPDGKIEFQSVSRPPGRPTVTLTSYFPKSQYSSVKRLSDKDREVLKKRLAELDPSGEAERQRMASLEIEVFDWPGKPGGGRRYTSEHFRLESTGSEELTRRSAVRLEQIYTAFVRFLPPTAQAPDPTLIMLATDWDEYLALLGRSGQAHLLNPAVYDPRANRILCGSDLKRLGSELQTVTIHHSQQLATLKQYEESVTKLYKGQELDRFLAPIKQERQRVNTADADNGKKFDKATTRVFAILYHEAFHAYVGTFVYPPLKPEEVKAGKGTGELPRWLNEGLAQVFETAVVEAGELRADAPDHKRLDRVKDWLRGKGKGPDDRLLSLTDLLTAGRDSFLAFHADQKAASDRAYLTSWALAYYLTFDRCVIGTPAFRKYLVAVNSGEDPRRAFTELVGRDLIAFEKDWHAYLLKLQVER